MVLSPTLPTVVPFTSSPTEPSFWLLPQVKVVVAPPAVPVSIVCVPALELPLIVLLVLSLATTTATFPLVALFVPLSELAATIALTPGTSSPPR